MSARDHFRVGALAAAALLSCTSTWALRGGDQPLPDFDAAGGLTFTQAPPAPSPARDAAVTLLESARGIRLEIVYNAVSGAPRSVTSSRPLSLPAAGNAEAIARSFLLAHRAIWSLGSDEVASLRTSAVYTDRHNGVSHVYFAQVAHGLPVFMGTVGVHLNGRNQVIGVGGGLVPGIRPPTEEALFSAAGALGAAADSIGAPHPIGQAGIEGQDSLFEPGSFLDPIRVGRTLYPYQGGSRLAYRMTLHKNGLEWYDILIDARTGEVLHRRNLYQFTSQVAPSAPAETSPAGPRGVLHPEHPLATVRGTGDLLRRYPFTVDPTGRPRGVANAPLNGAGSSPVTPHGGDPVNATIQQVLLPLPDDVTPLRSNALPLSTSPQSPEGWFIRQGTDLLTIGNNVDAKDDQSGDNEGSIGFRGNGGTSGNFTGLLFAYNNNYGSNGPYADAAARNAGAAPDLGAATLSLFYLSNWYHDFLYHLGFTEAAGNFQADNFGRGGLGGDSLFADAQDGSGTDNANFGTPADGSNPRMQMFLFTGPERDGDFDGDVIIHEYTHGLSNRLVGGPANVDCLGTPLVGESGSMGEGWGDWYAATIYDEPVVGEYATAVSDPGIRRFSMDRGPVDFTYGFLCTGPPSNPSLVPCEVHDGGEFWSLTLWEMRESMINRFHNRAFPGNLFPTSTGDFPDGNIRNAQGRTFDGSGNIAQIDHGAIENASFAALFRVTDGMKFAPCNPTMLDMRDAILAADRAAGSEFVDLIWRAFANRGLGEAATSTGGPAPVIVEDFTVPVTVGVCEAAGGPPSAPSFAANSFLPNTVRVSITPNGAAQYIISRGIAGAGSAVDPKAFVEVSRTTGTLFIDSGLDGGVTYTYRVRAARNDDCVSASNAVNVVPLGTPLPCTTDPTFAGLTRAVDAGDCERVLLDWPAATSNCAGGQQVTYNVYRSTDSGFTPGPASLIASGVAGNSHADTPGSTDTIYYYAVRAEDSTSGHGGPHHGGNEDGNAVRRSALVTSGVLESQGFADDVETGADTGTSAHFTSSGLSVSLIPQRGGWFRDDDSVPVVPASPVTVWHTFDPDNPPLSPSESLVFELRSGVITVTPESILTFWQTFQTEGGFDGGVVEAALVLDATTGAVGPFQDIGHLLYENGYNGVLDAPDSTNPLANRPAYTGGMLGPMKRTRAFLGALVPPAQSSQGIIIRFLFGNDAANTIPPSSPEGNFLPGWYIDDISIEQSCCPLTAAPLNLQAAPSGDGEITLTWQAPAGDPVDEYVIFREPAGDVIPQVFTHSIGTVPGSQTSFVDDEVAVGLTYAYVVRAVNAGGCPSESSNIALATATGACTVPPVFFGLEAVDAPPDASCQIDLSWGQGESRCPGSTLRYNVYRSTDPGFTPAPANARALGLSSLSFTDTNIVHGVTFHYIVRAEDTSSGEDDNIVRLSATPQGALQPAAPFADDLEPSAEPGYTTLSTRTAGGWQVIPDSTAHSATNAWVALDDQPGVPELTAKDDRLTLPVLNLTSASTMSFWHNFDFAQFPLSAPEAAFQSGGVLELSADGQSWIDLGPWILTGGYNGVLDADTQSALRGRPAWVGSSDLVPGTRAGVMSLVTVDLGTVIEDLFGTTVLPGARVRFRLGGTFQILIGGIQGSGWGVDDIAITGMMAPGVCTTDQDLDGTGDSGDCRPLDPTLESPAAPVSGVMIADVAGGSEVSWTSQDATAGSATTYDIVMGTVGDLIPASGFSSSVCGTNDYPDSPFTDPRGIQAGEILYWLLRADNACSAGPTSYGTSGGATQYRQPLDAGSPCPN